MLMELTVIPLAHGRSLSADLAEVIGLIDESGLPYRVHCIWNSDRGGMGWVDGIAKRCHQTIRKKTERVLILVRLDDYGNRADLLNTTVAHVKKRLGQSVKK